MLGNTKLPALDSAGNAEYISLALPLSIICITICDCTVPELE